MESVADLEVGPDRAPDSTGEAPPAPRRTYRWAWPVLAVVLAAEVMDLLDATVTSIAAPSVRADLGGSESMMQWLGAAYTLPFAVFLITGGRLGDIVGRRRLFLIGVAGFTAASVVCALSPAAGPLIAARLVQGSFGALLIPQGFGLIKQAFSDQDLGKAFAAFGPVMGLSAVGGPILGGYLVDADWFGTGWRMIFLINLPIGLLALVGAAIFLPRNERRTAGRLDPTGVLIVSVAAFALIYPLVEGHDRGWPAWTFALLAAGGLGFAGFVARELHRPGRALIEPTLLRNRQYLAGIGVALLFFAGMTGFMLATSLFCQLGLHFSAARTGLTLAPMSFGMALGSVASFGLVSKLGRSVIQIGILGMLAGLSLIGLMVHHAGAGTTLWTIAPGAFIGGLGIGLAIAPLFDVVLAGVTEAEVGSASGVLNAVQQLASSIGVAAVPTLSSACWTTGTGRASR